jgi:hypothetical protein
MQGGIDHIAIDRRNFELPRLGKYLSSARNDILLRGRGFIVIRGVPVERYSIAEAAAAFIGIGAYFGKPVSQNGKGHILGHVKDLGRSIEDPTARIYQTTHKQTFHTDSVDIVALLCLKTAKAGGLSRIVSSIFLYNEMFRRRPDLAAVLFEPLCFDRRGEVPAGKKGFYTTPIFSLVCRSALGHLWQPILYRVSAAFFRRASADRKADRSARPVRRAGQRSVQLSRHRVQARRYPAHPQPRDPARPHGLRGLA